MKKGTWIVFILVIVLGAVYFLTKNNDVSVGIKKIEMPKFESKTVDKIEILGKDNVTLVKQNDAWLLDIGTKDQPKLVKADQSNVEALLDAAQQVKHSHYVTNIKEKYEELGFKEGSTTVISLYAGANKAWSIALGKTDAASGRYAKLSDDGDVHVVRGSFWQLTRNDRNDWREREILPLKETDLTSFVIEKNGAPYVTLVKGEGDNWDFAKEQPTLPTNFRVNKSSLASLVRAGINLRANSFVDEAKTLSTPILTMKVGAGDTVHAVEFFPGPKDDYLVRRVGDDQIYEVTKFNYERLSKSIDEYRDMSVLTFDKDAITSVTLASGKDRVVLNKIDDKWQIVEPKKLPAQFEFDPNTVEDFLSVLSSVVGLRVATAKDVPQTPTWDKTWLVELLTDKGDKVHFYTGKIKSNTTDLLIKGNIDNTIYVTKAGRLSAYTGLNAFKKEEFELPPIDERTKGFESLPVDVQRKLLKATQQKK